MHLLVAYWTMTSAYKKEWSLREVRNHIKKADAYKAECAAYELEIHFHRSLQTRASARAALKTAKENGYPDNELLTGPLTLADFETAVRDPDSFSDIQGLDKYKKLADKFQCSNCRGTIHVLMSCGQCGNVSYCNRNCQREHWKRAHKKECKKKNVKS
jgi:hypothetical protein